MTTTIQRLAAGPLHWHRHAAAYAAIVLDGGYTERGDGGVGAAAPGDVVIHSPFERHANAIGRTGAAVVNVPLTPAAARLLKSGGLDDPLTAIAAINDGLPPVDVLGAVRRPIAEPALEEADLLAEALRVGRTEPVESLSLEFGIAPRTMRRHFVMLYGMSAARFRARARAKRAWAMIAMSDQALSAIAAELGFADQAHMTRSVVLLTGHPPKVWRYGRLIQDRSGGRRQ